jgi:amino acid transporter
MVVDSSSPLLAQANSKGTSGGASASPFVVAITSAGIKVLPSIINAAIFLFTFSASNSDQYIASRTLYGMAKDGHAPRIFAKCTNNGSPWVAFIFTACFMGLAYTASSTEALVVFNYMASTVTLFASLAWISILSCHIAFMRGMKRQGISRDILPYRSPFQPYLTYYGLSLTVIISLLKGFDSFMPWSVVGFVTNYLAIPIYVFGFLGYKLIRKTQAVKLSEIDFDIDTEEYADIESDVEEDKMLSEMNWKQKLWYRLQNW